MPAMVLIFIKHLEARQWHKKTILSHIKTGTRFVTVADLRLCWFKWRFLPNRKLQMLNQALQMKVHCTCQSQREIIQAIWWVFFPSPQSWETLSSALRDVSFLYRIHTVLCFDNDSMECLFFFFLRPKTVCLGAQLLSRPQTHWIYELISNCFYPVLLYCFIVLLYITYEANRRRLYCNLTAPNSEPFWAARSHPQ